jgi:3-hydroxybutyryl-CoA dehydrogenase
MTVKQIFVAGAGQMGAGIAQVAAQAGYQVILWDVTHELAQRGLSGIDRFLARAVEKGKLTAADRSAALGRIRPVAEFEPASAAELVIEAVVEDARVKRELFGRLDGICPEAAILASNTSSLPITELGAVTRRPDRVIGMHFMNPVPLMQLVEVIRGVATSDSTYQAVEEVARRMGKTPVTVQDSPGFVANRILMPMINEAIYCLQEGLASPEGIDTVMKLGMNHPMGPLALADLIGLDTVLSILDVLHEEFRDSKYRASPLLRKLVRAGWLGKKTGRGFYSY